MYQIPKFNPKKITKRRGKLRSLTAEKEAEPEPNNFIRFYILIGSVLIFILLASIYISKISTSMLWGDFLNTYRSQYNLVVYGKKDYCQPNFDVAMVFSDIRDKVVNQDAALAGLEQKLRNDSRFIAIGVAGSSGIGKSLFAQEFMNNFPWPENVQFHYWSTINMEDNKQHVESFTKRLSECGRNLIIIDNLQQKDVDFIEKYNGILIDNVLEQDSINLAVIYVFNVGTYTTDQSDSYNETMQILEELKNVEVQEFRKFELDDVKECIEQEINNLNLTLDKGDFEEIVELIDANRSGCKNVYSKVMMFGKRKNP